MIAVPCYDQLVTEPFFMSMMKTIIAFKDIGLKFGISTLSDSLITRARNQLVAKFMDNEEFTHLMFIDADIGWVPDDILKMLWHDKDIITGSYPIKNIDWNKVHKLANEGVNADSLMAESLRYVVNPVKDREGSIPIEKGALSIYDAGTGFMMIKREVFTKMFSQYPDLKYNDDTGSLTKGERQYTYALFNSYVDDDGRLLSEDYGFCRYWQNMNGQIWVDPTIELSHLGRMKYQGKMIDSLKYILKTE